MGDYDFVDEADNLVLDPAEIEDYIADYQRVRSDRGADFDAADCAKHIAARYTAKRRAIRTPITRKDPNW